MLTLQLIGSTPAPPSIDKVKSLIAAQKDLTYAKLGITSKREVVNGGQQPCTCGVFLSGQFTKGSSDQPKGLPALVHEQETTYACNALGNKQCTNKCLDAVVKHLPNSPSIICGTIDRDCHKERAYLFVQNCEPLWINTNLSAGREYCCKNGEPYKCPLV